MQRIILHWTGGGHSPSARDLSHYHFVIDGAGWVHSGVYPVQANYPPLRPGTYAAHTRGANSGAIGVALTGMAGAIARPFDPGRAPLTPLQIPALVRLCNDLMVRNAIALRRETVLTHAEVEPVLGIAQRGKWDITWLPGMECPGDPRAVGAQIRALIAAGQVTAAGPSLRQKPCPAPENKPVA